MKSNQRLRTFTWKRVWAFVRVCSLMMTPPRLIRRTNASRNVAARLIMGTSTRSRALERNRGLFDDVWLPRRQRRQGQVVKILQKAGQALQCVMLLNVLPGVAAHFHSPP